MPHAPLTTTVRHQAILTRLRDAGHVRARELHRELGVTPMTVWRDLRTLEEQGLLRRRHGGAERLGRAPGEPDFEAKGTVAAEAKRRIAAAAVAEFVRAGDTLALEGGTTVAALLEFLPDTKISLLTNSLPVALRARAVRPQLPVHVAGGWLSPVSGNVAGPDTLRFLERQSASLCFISATGFDAVRGPLDPNPLEIEAKRALAARARRVVLLLDARKFAVASTAVAIHPRRLHALVTDQPPPRPIARLLRTHGVRLIVAGARAPAA
jgi:DeoR/GlpR family transcriptional regulator of sugar metabolism